MKPFCVVRNIMGRTDLVARIWLCAALILIASTGASAATWCVNPIGNGGCKTTISAAVAAASAGDTIRVAKGTYHEIVVLDKSYLSLVGANQRDTIIDASGLSIAVGANTIANGI